MILQMTLVKKVTISFIFAVIFQNLIALTQTMYVEAFLNSLIKCYLFTLFFPLGLEDQDLFEKKVEHFGARLDEIIVCNCQDKNDLKTNHLVIGGLLQQSGTYNQFSYVKALKHLFSQDQV